tara:strand:+ start:306 stop:521 length:216 start_codon:yes stop_codon:yes gene_type:complete
MKRKAETVSVRVREETYAAVKALAKTRGVKAVDIFDMMLEKYLEPPRPMPRIVDTEIDASHRPVGKYMQGM